MRTGDHRSLQQQVWVRCSLHCKCKIHNRELKVRRIPCTARESLIRLHYLDEEGPAIIYPPPRVLPLAAFRHTSCESACHDADIHQHTHSDS